VSDYCSQTFYGLLFSYLTITDVTSYVHHKFPVSFLLYIATKTTCQINQIIIITYSNDLGNLTWMLLFPRLHKKKNSCTPCVPMFHGSFYKHSVCLCEKRKLRGGLKIWISFSRVISFIYIKATVLHNTKYTE